MKITIHKKYKDRVVGFNGSVLPLGKRKDLDVLAEIAIRSQDKSLLEVFEELPTIEQMQAAKAKALISKHKKSQDAESNKNTQDQTTD